MINFPKFNTYLDKFKIPTLLGLTILFIGIGAGVFLVLQEQTLSVTATPNQKAENITFSNIEDEGATISWQTVDPVQSFITYGINSDSEQTALDDRDRDIPQIRRLHHVTLKSLTPQTVYQFKIHSGKVKSDTLKFTTASSTGTQNGFKPVIGSAIDADQSISEGIAYLTIPNAIIQSAPIKNFGNFLIPISLMRKQDLSEVFVPDQTTEGRLTVVTGSGQASTTFNLYYLDHPIILRAGQNIDIRSLQKQVEATHSATELSIFDLNGDGQINASDHAVVLKNFGRNPQDKRTDFNKDGMVDEKDLTLIYETISEAISAR